MSYAIRMSDNRSPFVTWLVSYRLKHGLSQGDLAHRLGVTKSRISQIEIDYRNDTPMDFAKKLRPHLSRAEWLEAKEALLKQMSERLDEE